MRWMKLEPIMQSEVSQKEKHQYNKLTHIYGIYKHGNDNPQRRQWHPSTLAWKIPWMEEPGRLQSMGSRRVGLDWATSLSLFTFMHWRRKWQPTQCSCLENPRDGGAWWAAIYGVAQSRTRLTRLNSNENPVCETVKETQMYWTVFWTLWERAKVGWYRRMALKHVNYHIWNESPVQFHAWYRVLGTGALGWPRGIG